MLSALRSRVTYANVTATLALLFAMTGGAYAAKAYLITSTKQIKPSVLKSLQGKAGAKGANAAAPVNCKKRRRGNSMMFLFVEVDLAKLMPPITRP